MLRLRAIIMGLALGLAAGLFAVPTAGAAPGPPPAAADAGTADPSPEPVPATLRGQVRGSGGAPLAGARVTFHAAGFVTGDDPAYYAATATTDARGRWQLDSGALFPGGYLIRAGHVGHDAGWFGGDSPEEATVVPVTPTTDRGSLDIVLTGLPIVSGTIAANGRRVAGLAVSATPLQSLPPEYDPEGLHTLSVAGGGYTLTVPSGSYTVEVSDPEGGLPTRWYPRTRREGSARVLTLAGGQVIDGIDVDASFQPRFPGRPRAKPKGLRPPKGLARRPMDPITEYDGQRKCRPRPKPGTVALAHLLRRRYGPVVTGLSRACARDRSEHYDGRAIDWMVNSRIRSQARKGDDFVKWLTMSRGRHAGAMARRLGIMYVIWRDRIWGVYQAADGWRPYNNCLTKAMNPRIYDNGCHRNHVHISLTWRGARQRTSWWQ